MDWTLFARYAALVVPALITYALGRYDKRSKLISYLGHASSVRLKPPGQPEFSVNAHSVVVRNAGRKAANNVRLGHYSLPAFSVYPSTEYKINELPDGSFELLIPLLVPGEQITVTYLYYAPQTVANINSYTKSDDGLVRVLTMLPSPQMNPWLARMLWFLIATGGVTLIYAIGQAAAYFVHAAHG